MIQPICYRLSIPLSLVSIIFGLVFAWPSLAVDGWSNPSLQAPNGNIPQPINVSAEPQTKDGTLMLSVIGGDVLILSNKSNPGQPIKFKIPNTNIDNTWILPAKAGVADQVLVISSVDSTGKIMTLKWDDATDINSHDDDWYYYDDEAHGPINASRFVGVTTADWKDETSFNNNNGSRDERLGTDAGTLYVQKNLGVDGTAYLDTLNVEGYSRFAMNATYDGNLHINAGDKKTGNLFNIFKKDDTDQSVFAVTATGTLAVGKIPWARLDPSIKSCEDGQVITGITSAGIQCDWGGIPKGSAKGQTLRWDGWSWNANEILKIEDAKVIVKNGARLQLEGSTSLYMNMTEGAIPVGNSSGSLGFNLVTFQFLNNILTVGNGNPNSQAINSKGHIFPSVDNAFDLGSGGGDGLQPYRWRNLFVSNLNISGLLEGSVIFQGPLGLAQNNDNFHWDNYNQSLSLGSKNNRNNFQIMSQELVGYGTISTEGTLVTGSGTYFSSDLAPGSELIIGDQVRLVSRVVSEEEMIIESPFASDLTSTEYRYKTRNFALESYIDNDQDVVGSDGLYVSGIYDPLFKSTWATMGAVYLGSHVFMHNSGMAGSGDLEQFNTFQHVTNTFLGSDAGLSHLDDIQHNDDSRFNSNTLTGIGYKSMYGAISSESSTGVGAYTLYNNGGSYNTAVGAFSLHNNASGKGNTAIGYNTMFNYFSGSNLTSDNNLAIGNRALFSNTSGSNNLALGANAGHSNMGSNNIFIGYNSGYSIVGDNNFVVANQDSNEFNSFLYGTLGSNNTKRMFRVNAELQFGISNNLDSNLAPFVKAVRGLTNKQGICLASASGSTELFLVNGVIICTQYNPSPSCLPGSTLDTCCAQQNGGCGF